MDAKVDAQSKLRQAALDEIARIQTIVEACEAEAAYEQAGYEVADLEVIQFEYEEMAAKGTRTRIESLRASHKSADERREQGKLFLKHSGDAVMACKAFGAGERGVQAALANGEKLREGCLAEP